MTSLDRPLRIVKLTDADGKSYVVKIGARQALSKRTYVQREGSEVIHLVDADLNADMRRGPSDYRSKRLAEFNQADAVRIEVLGDHQYTLVKAGEKWMLDSPVKGRADAAKVGGMLRAFSSLNVGKFIEEVPKTLRPYGLESPRLKVAVTVETRTPRPAASEPADAPPAEPEYETKTQTICLAFGGGAENQVFARIDDETRPTVFEVPEASVAQLAPPLLDLRDKRITQAQTNQAQRITVVSAAGPLELSKAGGVWQMSTGPTAGPPMPAEFVAVDDFLKALRDLTAVGFEPAELPTFGFADPRATIELAIEGQVEPERFAVGGLTASKTGAYLRNDREGFIAVVKAESADALVVGATSFMSRDLLRFSGSMASRVELTRQGETVAVVREGGEWMFASPVLGKAESAAVNNIVADLSNLRGRQVVGLAPDVAKFGLSTAAAMVRVTVDTPPLAVKKPSPPPASEPALPLSETAPQPADQATDQPTTEPAEPSAAEEIELLPQPPVVHTVFVTRHEGKVYAMVEGGSTICEVDAKVLEDIEAELFDTRVVALNAADARRLEFGGAVPFAFEKNGNDWTLVGEATFQADPAKITAVLNALRDLKAQRFVRYAGADPKDYGLDQPAVIVRAETEGGEVAALSISSTGPQSGDRYASIAAAPDRVFVISADDVNTFGKQVQDFGK